MHSSESYTPDFSHTLLYNAAYYNKLYEKDMLIQKQNKHIDKLNIELMKKNQENQTLKGFKKQCYNLEEQLKEIEKEMKKLHQEKNDIIEKQHENKSLFKRKIIELENLIEYEKLEHEKNTALYDQKMGVYNQLVMENEIYSEEVKKLKNDIEIFEKNKKEEFQKLKVENLIKFEKVKKRMFNTMKQMNIESDKLNNEYIETSNKLSILQNKQLMIYIDFQKQKIKELQKINEELTQKNIELEKENETHKLVEKDLLIKSKSRNGETIMDNSLERTKTRYRTFYFKKPKDIHYYKELSQKSKKNKKSLNKEEDYNSDQNNIKPRKNNSMTDIISKPTVIEKRLLNYQKEIKEKNLKNENVLLINSKLKNRLHLYYNKFNGLFFFLEECLQKFFRDQSLLENKHFILKMDDIKKFKFDELNDEEKYAVLVLLMKHLMPLITLNFNNKDNIGKELFKTNLNIIDKNYSMNQNYLQDKLLKNAFMDNNKYYKDLHVSRNTFSNSSIPVLRKIQDIDLDLYEFKNKAIFS